MMDDLDRKVLLLYVSTGLPAGEIAKQTGLKSGSDAWGAAVRARFAHNTILYRQRAGEDLDARDRADLQLFEPYREIMRRVP